MARRDDEAAIMKMYGLSNLDPHKWEDVKSEGSNLVDSMGDDEISKGEMEDPLGLMNRLRLPRDMDLQSLAPTLLSSKQFSPSAFLSTHHPDATFQDLQAGIQNLRENVDSRGEEVRILVEREFGRFVSVKGSGDAVYKEMKSDFLADGTDYGTREVREILKVTSHKAETIYLPLLSNSLKAQKLKSTLGVFERSKFLFGLPRSLRMNIRAGKYDLALKDYSKGLYLLQSRPNQLLPISTSGSSTSLSATANASVTIEQKRKEQQKRVFDKIWKEVEKIVGEMRADLEDGLAQGGLGGSVEDVERSIEILLELNPREDPTWIYLDAQHNFIMDHMRKVYEAQVKKLEVVQAASKRKNVTDKQSARSLQKCVQRLAREGGDVTISKSAGYEVWEALYEVVKRLSDVIVHTLPGYWKICRAYSDGKYKKRDGSSFPTSSRRSPAHARAQTLDIIKSYVSLLARLFTLSDVAIATSPGSNAESVPPDFVPLESNSITTCHFVARILGEIVECVGELEGVASVPEAEQRSSSSSGPAGGDARSVLKGLVESTRWRFEEAICETWARDAKIFFNLESWSIDPKEKSTTLYLAQIQLFQKHNALAAWQVAGGGKDASSSKAANVPMSFITKVKNAFFDCLYFLLDGLVHLAFSEYQPLTENVRKVGDGVQKVNTGGIDPYNTETRILLTISNLTHLKSTVLPQLIERFEKLYGVTTTGDRKTLDDVVEQLDSILVGDLIKRKAEPLAEIVKQGLVGGGIGWAEGGKPTEVRAYLFRALLYLVQTHSQINDTAPILVKRILELLLEALTRSILECYNQIKHLEIGGMLTATLEVEFLHQTLLQYVTPTATGVLNEIYSTISQAFRRDKHPGDLQPELEDLKKILVDARRATQVDYLCFKVAKVKKEDSQKGHA